MRTLIVAAEPPFPPAPGADPRGWQHAQAAARVGPAVIMSLSGGAAAPTLPPGIVAAALSNVPPGALWRRDPRLGGDEIVLPAGAEDRLAEIAAAFAPDTVLLEGIDMHGLMPGLAQASARLIIDVRALRSPATAERARASLPFRLGRWRAARHAAREQAAQEQRILAAADAIWVSSAEDGAQLRALLPEGKPVHIVPTGIPRPESAPGALQPWRPARGDGRIAILFVSELGRSADIEAAQWLATTILPDLKKAVPGVVLVLAGRTAASAVTALAGKGVEIAADGADAKATLPDDILSEAQIAVLPLPIAGRAQALEAMSRGLPLVATRQAVDGLDLVPDQHFLFAESRNEFKNQINKLLNNHNLSEKLRHAAFQHCLRRFGPAATSRSIQQALAGD